MALLIYILIVILTISNLNASELEQGSFFNLNFFWSVLNFILLLYILFYFNRKSLHIGDYIKNRKARFEKEKEDAEREKIEAERRYRELLEKKNNLEREIINIRNQALAQIEVQKKTIEESARIMSGRIKKEANMIVEAEIARMREEIRNEIIELATEKAIELIREKFSDEDQGRLEEEFLLELKKRSVV